MAKPDLMSNLKFKRLCRELNLPRPYVLGLLQTLWESAYASANAFIGTGEDVECAAEWPGNPGILTAALTKSGFLDHDDSGYFVHDLYDHAPDYVQKRMTRRKNKDLQPISADNTETCPTNGAERRTTYLPTNPTHQPHPPIGGDKPPRRPTPADVEEVATEGAKIMLSRDSCEAFHDYYTSNGWKVGRNPMRDWRAALRKWKRTSFEHPPTSATLSPTRGAFDNLPPEVK